MNAVFYLPQAQRLRLEKWASSAYPHEACGLLLGSRSDRETRVVEARSARNVQTLRASDRYEIDPVDYLAAENAAAEAGLDLVGIWHTHPDHPARPSETDRALAWDGWSYLIVATGVGGASEMRSWRLDADGAFQEEVIRS